MPDGWALTRIVSLLNIQTGASFKKEQASNNNSQVRVLRGGNIQIGTYSFFDNDIFIEKKLISENILLKKNDLITPAVTSIENIGKLALIEKDYCNVTAGGFVFILRPILSDEFLAKYLHIALQSSYFNRQLKSITKKSGQAFYNLGKERLLQLIIPIPPIQEQQRIAAKIQDYMPLIQRYNELEVESTQLDNEIYDKLKKSILQFAIQGKLVSQDPNDEPASVLLEKIRQEKKVKLGKKYIESYIYKADDNCYYEKVGKNEPVLLEDLPFNIPNSWSWSRLKNISYTQTGTTPSTNNANNFGNYIPFIKPGDIFNDKINYNNEGLSKEGLQNGRLINKNSILMVCIGGSLGKCALIDRDVSCNQQINTATPLQLILPSYLYFVLNSDYFYKTANYNSTGTATPIINRTAWENIIIPIAPHEEQERICMIIKKALKSLEKDEN